MVKQQEKKEKEKRLRVGVSVLIVKVPCIQTHELCNMKLNTKSMHQTKEGGDRIVMCAKQMHAEQCVYAALPHNTKGEGCAAEQLVCAHTPTQHQMRGMRCETTGVRTHANTTPKAMMCAAR
jgi:hypothetical protein